MTRVGRTVASRYHIERLLGVGGMGAVYEARHLELGTRVALKMLHPKMVTNAQLASRFRVEAQKAADIRHPGIVDVRDLGQDEQGCPFMAMELLDGSNLEALIARGPMPVEQAVAIVEQALDALAAAHARGIIHRDLKPANLFLTRDARGTPIVKILDFGIAKVLADGGPSMTRTGLTMGTVEYMSPEQIRDSKSIDARADLYSMGVTLYEMLTGRRNTSGDTPLEVVARVVQGHFDRHPAAVRPDVPPWLDEVVARSLDPAADGRFASAAEMLDALRRGVVGAASTLRSHAGPGVAPTVVAPGPAPFAAGPSSGPAASFGTGTVGSPTPWLGGAYAPTPTPTPAAVASVAQVTPTPTVWSAPSPSAGAAQPPIRPLGARPSPPSGRGWITFAAAGVALLVGVVAIGATALVLRGRRTRSPAATTASVVSTPSTGPATSSPVASSPAPQAPTSPPTPPVPGTPPSAAPVAPTTVAPVTPAPVAPVTPATVAPVAPTSVPSPAPSVAPVVGAAVPLPSSSPTTLTDYAGRFAVVGQPANNVCGGRVFLAARHVTVDDGAGTMFADVVRRTYVARVDQGRLVAEGTFPIPGCRQDRLVERWIFERTSGGLRGTLDSTWSLPPRCSARCTAVFALTATPAAAPAPRRRARSGGGSIGGARAAGY